MAEKRSVDILRVSWAKIRGAFDVYGVPRWQVASISQEAAVISINEGKPGPHGFIHVLATDEGATDPAPLREALLEKYAGKNVIWRVQPEAFSQDQFESDETLVWCAARLVVW